MSTISGHVRPERPLLFKNQVHSTPDADLFCDLGFHHSLNIFMDKPVYFTGEDPCGHTFDQVTILTYFQGSAPTAKLKCCEKVTDYGKRFFCHVGNWVIHTGTLGLIKGPLKANSRTSRNYFNKELKHDCKDADVHQPKLCPISGCKKTIEWKNMIVDKTLEKKSTDWQLTHKFEHKDKTWENMSTFELKVIQQSKEMADMKVDHSKEMSELRVEKNKDIEKLEKRIEYLERCTLKIKQVVAWIFDEFKDTPFLKYAVKPLENIMNIIAEASAVYGVSRVAQTTYQSGCNIF